MSNLIPINYNLKFSYKVNSESTTMSYQSDEPYYITVNSLDDINLILTPSNKNNIKWTNIMSYNLEIRNLSSSPISNFSVKLNSPENLSYISGTLVNSQTGQYYPLRDWQNEFDVLDTLQANSSLNVKYSMQISANNGTSVISPISFDNSGRFGTTTTFNNSNISTLNISEPKIIYDNANYTLQNTGTIPYSFTYKFTIPSGKTYDNAKLDGILYTNISHKVLGSYAIFTITNLPPQTSESSNILQIFFKDI